MSEATYLHKYNIPCGTCGNVVSVWRATVPTECPNNEAHEIDSSNIMIVETTKAPSTFTQYFPVPNPNNNVGEFPVDDSETVRLTFHVPCDFLALYDLVMIGIPDTTSENADYDLHSSYGCSDTSESYNQHQESNTSATYDVEQNKLVPIQIDDVFSNIEARDVCGLRIVSNTGKFRPVAICICYYRKEPVEVEE